MNNEQCLKLIQLYGSHRRLWDSQSPEYNIRRLRDEAWGSIAREMKYPLADLKKKMESLMGAYRREKSRERKSQTTGRVYASYWYAYEAFNFMRDKTDPTNTQATEPQKAPKKIKRKHEEVDIEEQVEEEEEDQEIEYFLEDNFEEEEEEIETVAPKVKVKKERIDSTLRRKTVRAKPRLKPTKQRISKDSYSQLDSRLLETLRLLRKSEVTKKKDECDKFGEYIAISLRKHDERTRSMIKQAINNILFEQEMKKYSSNHYEVVLSSMEENPLILPDQEHDSKMD